MFDYCRICRIIVAYWKNYYRPFATIKIRFGFNPKDLKRKENGTKSSPVFGDKTDRTEMDTLKKHGPIIILQQVFGRRCSWSIWLQASLSDLHVLVCLVCFTIYYVKIVPPSLKNWVTLLQRVKQFRWSPSIKGTSSRPMKTWLNPRV